MNNNDLEPRELSLGDILRIFKKRFFWFLGTALLVGALTVVYLFVATPIYEATVTVKIDPSTQNTISDIFSTSYSYTGRPDISTEVELIKSRTNLERVINELRLLEKEKEKEKRPEDTMDEMVRNLSDWVTVSPVKDTKVVKISVQHPDPKLATDIANKLAEVYNQLLMSLSKNQYTAKRKFIEEQIPKIESELKSVEEEIRKFKEENNFFVLDEEAKWLLQMLSQYDNQLNEVEIQIEETKTNIRAIKDLLSKVDQRIVSSETIGVNPVVLQLRQKLTDLNVELTGLRSTYPESSPKVIAVKQQIVEVEQMLKKEVEKVVTSQVQTINPMYSDLISQLSSEEAKLQVLLATKDSVEKVKNEYQTRVELLPKLEQRLLEMERNLRVKESLYTLLLEKLEETKIAEAGVTGNAQIVDRATVPTIPVKPNKKLTLAIGGVLGIFLGILVVFMREYLDKTVKDEEEIQILAPEVPIIGRIPRYDFNASASSQEELIVKDHPTSPVSEGIKLAAMNALFVMGPEGKLLAVTSPGPGDGKTIMAANIATAFAQNGYKTLLLDLDMRRPRVEKVFGLDRVKMGITSRIFKNIPVEEMTVSVFENLDIIPVGALPPNPTVILTNPVFSEVMRELREKYQKVVIDLPPILVASDALIVGKQSDGVVLVVRANATQKSSLRLAYENLRAIEAKILGVLVNDITEKYSSYYYYHYYYYYTEDRKERKRKRRKAGSKKKARR